MRKYSCTGEYRTGDGVVICNDVHGTVDFEKALSRSCNSAFTQIALELGRETLEKTFGNLGFYASREIGRVDTAKGLFDVLYASDAELGWAAIGQHTTMVTPFSVMTLMGAVANGGIAVKPYYVESVKNSFGIKTYSAPKGVSMGRYMSGTTANLMRDALWFAVTDYYGESGFENMRLCAKTGTAEVGGGSKPHAWFAGFLMREDFPYAFVVIVENGGGGFAGAAPVARKVLRELFNTLNL